MQNLFLIPTNKPSRLYSYKGSLGLAVANQYGSDAIINQHLYITNDEEIKEIDWHIYENEAKKTTKETLDYIDSSGDEGFKKIILTTDQDLIKDGVQAIDDKFLQWFVNNSSCEFVEVIPLRKSSGWYDEKEVFHWDFLAYKIIIPKEEPLSYDDFRKKCPKDLLIKFDTDCSKYSENGNSDNYFYANCKYWENKLKEELKQKITFEEIEKQIALTEMRGMKIVKYLDKYKGQSIYNEIALAIEFGYQFKLGENE